MRKVFLFLLPALLCLNLAFSHSGEFPWSFRVNGIYVDEVYEDGDEGIGGSTELGFVLNGGHNISQIIGFEVGYIRSDDEGGSSDVLDLPNLEPITFTSFGDSDVEIVPLFLNLTFVASCETGFVLELGAGIGAVYVETDLDLDIDSDLGLASLNENDNDFVFGGQVFGRLGFELTDRCSLFAGARYMMSNDIEFQNIVFEDEAFDIFVRVEDSPLDSIAYDLSLQLKF